VPDSEAPQDDTDQTVSTEEAVSPTGNPSDPTDDADPLDEQEQFPRDYVEKLRDDMAKYRQRARTADTLGQRLHLELVKATGRLADPTDLAYSEEHLEDPERLAAAIDDLRARKPHLASRKPVGQIGQGAAPSAGTVDLAAMLRQRAR
jgi:hypothetical protein